MILEFQSYKTKAQIRFSIFVYILHSQCGPSRRLNIYIYIYIYMNTIYTRDTMARSAVDAKADEPYDGSMACLTRCWSDESHGINDQDQWVRSGNWCCLSIGVAFIDGNLKKNNIAIKRLPWLKLKPLVQTTSTFARVKKGCVLLNLEIRPQFSKN